MAYTEQEKLARLITPDEAVDTGEMLGQELLSLMGAPDPEYIQQVQMENDDPTSRIQFAESDGETHAVNAIKGLRKVSTISQSRKTVQAGNINNRDFKVKENPPWESILINSYEIRDNLIDLFSDSEMPNSASSVLAEQISLLGAIIVSMGGEVEPFDPLSQASGLAIPNQIANAKEVVKRTLQCYKAGHIQSAKLSSDGNRIYIVFSGAKNGNEYTADGTIESRNWTGNEAIDYVYTPESGKMSVKTFENGRWVNTSDKHPERYEITWSLKEIDEDAMDEEIGDQENDIG